MNRVARRAGAFALAIGALTVIRLIVAAIAPLAPDEAYYWVWSHALAFGYLDHPPMVALWIKAGTLLAGQTTLGVRLLGPLSAAAASWMLFDAARCLFPGTKAPFVAVLLLNATLLLGVGAVIMTPDTPLLFFWTATLWACSRLTARAEGVWWLLAGLFGGLALDSKYTALLLWIGVGLWLVLVPAVRPWLRRWQPWAACTLGALLFAPVLLWNASHGWAGILRQGGRVEDWHPSRSAGFLAELVGGQIGLATPLIWVVCMAGGIAAIRRTWRERQAGWSLLAGLSLPPVVVFVQHALGDRVQGNWPAIIYPALAIAAAELPLTRRWYSSATALGCAVTALAYLQATTGLIPVPARLDPITMRLAGWDDLARQVEAARQTRDARYIAVEGYGLASELAWWLPPGTPVVGTDTRWALTTLPFARIEDQPGLLIRDVRRTDPPEWPDARQIGVATRPGNPTDGYALFLLHPPTEQAARVLPRR